MISQDDAAFLAELTGFLDDYEAPIEIHEPDLASNLLLDSDQLLVETEALLLSSNEYPTEPAHAELSTVERVRKMKNAQAAKRRLKYRKKLRSERETLEDEEKLLSEELEELQRARKRAKALGDKTLATSTWRAIAIRQKEGRLVAEEQQRRLQNAVENRAKAIEEIARMIRDDMKGSKHTANIEMDKRSLLKLNADDTVLFDEFLDDLEVMYPRTDEVFQACGAEEKPTMSYRLGPHRKREGDVEYIDNLDVLLIPFSFEQTCDTMWQSMTRLYRQRDWYHYNVTDPENTLAVKSHVQVARESGESVQMIVHCVMRRVLEKERMVVVWRALSEGEGEFSGIHSDETGWCIVRPNDSDEPLLRVVMQTFVRFIPMDVSNTPSNDVGGYQFTKFVVSSVEEDGAEIARMMDSLLLEDLRS
ncbi:hypothetical protein F443_13391 [Phytophthora nicotianae P1569]|uniref:Uncharacterized protein n=1 Tax=Phytophthora nicotianae P1569 TaxID=1317065 RepID=V9ESC6_PHYNI|nr:hypothetical protein F443_13391 [Phytophthora nicotianae P1569]